MGTSHHPRFDELSDFLADESPESGGRVAAHLSACESCRESLAFLRDATAAAESMPASVPISALRARVMADVVSGSPAAPQRADIVHARQRRWILPAAAAILLAFLGIALVARRPSEIEAGTTSGTLTFTPAAPRPGQRVVVRYQPSALLRGQPWLSLRARLRSPSGASYNGGLPTLTVAVLRPDSAIGAGAFVGTLALPDSVVYGVFAVEDGSATVIDDNASRGWELMVSDTGGKPLFEALDQRANDMMGRNWEEGFATVRHMVALYPEDLRGWSWLRSFQGWIGRASDDSVRQLHRNRLASFDSAFSHGRVPTTAEVGRMAWYAYRIDSSSAARWRARLLQDAPANSFAIQWRLIDITNALHDEQTPRDTAAALRRLEELWQATPGERREQVASASFGLALASGDRALIERWAPRLQQSAKDRAEARRWVATRLAKVSSMRREGIRQLRAELDTLSTFSPAERALTETVADQRARHAATRRRVQSALGEALVADGQAAEAGRTLSEAASSGWDLDVFRAVRSASLAAGDTARALTMAARLAVDPRTTRAAADSLRTVAERQISAIEWRRQIDSARVTYMQRMLADASVRSLPRNLRLRALDGKSRQLRDLTDGRVTVIGFWSRSCGPAIDALPRMRAAAGRLQRDGMRFVSIVLDESSPSAGLESFLADNKVTMPTYLDAWYEASRAFNQWGTPSYYIVDGDGRMRFGVTNDVDEALARAEALRLAAATPRAALQRD